MDSPVNEIKQRLNIVDVVREYLPHLKPAGSNWKGICPFHSEKTPSFMVSTDKGIWHCFGCNEGGDMFTFVMKINGIEFPDALRMLADKAGVTLRRTDPQLLTLRNKLLDMHIIAEEFFKSELINERGKKAKEYLAGRDISEAQIKDLGLGFSPNLWDGLNSLLLKKGFTPREILSSGLIVKNEQGRVYDRFRNRLMFPLRNLQGQVIGFAGRTLLDEDAKYINSPQTMLYNKSEFLYGLDKAKSAIRGEDAVIVVEGYFDWISVFSAGMKNVVAVSGTALTKEHIVVLKRYTGNIVFAFDTDSAGKDAFKKGALLALESGCAVYLINYGAHGFKDPDELIKKDQSLWGKLYEGRVLALEHLLDEFFSNVKPGDIIAKKKALRGYIPFLKRAGGIEKEHFASKLSQVSGISESLIEEEMKNVKVEQAFEKIDVEGAQITEASVGWRWVSLLVAYPSVFLNINEKVSEEHIKDSEVASAFRSLRKFYSEMADGDFSLNAFRKTNEYSKLLDIWLLKVEDLYKSFTASEIEKEAKLLTAKVKEEYYRDVLLKVTREIADAEREKNEEKVSRLLRIHTTIASELADLLK